MSLFMFSGNVYIRPVKKTLLSYFLPRRPNFELVLLDHGLYRTLTNSFRLDYAHLWDALIRSDEKEIEEYTYKLFLQSERVSKGGVDHHRLFASMLTGRSWEAISSESGLASARTSAELNLITTKASQGNFLIAISEVLAKLPSELLLLLKTNDLLRAVDESLVRDHGNSADHMLRVLGTMGWYCNLAIWQESTEGMILFRWLQSKYWCSLFRFWFVSARLLALDFYLTMTWLRHRDST
jgi:aarF domain-containing kinase